MLLHSGDCCCVPLPCCARCSRALMALMVQGDSCCRFGCQQLLFDICPLVPPAVGLLSLVQLELGPLWHLGIIGQLAGFLVQLERLGVVGQLVCLLFLGHLG